MIFNILDNTTELWMTKYIIGEIFSSGGATLYKNHSDQTVYYILFLHEIKKKNNNRKFYVKLIFFQVLLPTMDNMTYPTRFQVSAIHTLCRNFHQQRT